MSADNQRMLDLLRVCRAELFTQELITDEEYAWLAALPSQETHLRLDDYADLRAQVKRLTAERDAWANDYGEMADKFIAMRAERDGALSNLAGCHDRRKAAEAEVATLTKKGEALAEALRHLRWCRSCAEDGWDACAGGRQADAALAAWEKPKASCNDPSCGETHCDCTHASCPCYP